MALNIIAKKGARSKFHFKAVFKINQNWLTIRIFGTYFYISRNTISGPPNKTIFVVQRYNIPPLVINALQGNIVLS